MLLELDLRMQLYFFQKIIMFELLYILQNWSFWLFPKLSDYVIFSLIMQSDAARGQLCEIAPAHNIRIPDMCVYRYECVDALIIMILNSWFAVHLEFRENSWNCVTFFQGPEKLLYLFSLHTWKTPGIVQLSSRALKNSFIYFPCTPGKLLELCNFLPGPWKTPLFIFLAHLENSWNCVTFFQGPEKLLYLFSLHTWKTPGIV